MGERFIKLLPIESKSDEIAILFPSNEEPLEDSSGSMVTKEKIERGNEGVALRSNALAQNEESGGSKGSGSLEDDKSVEVKGSLDMI